MHNYSKEELNQIAMQMILHAGNGRDHMNTALCTLEDCGDYCEYKKLMEISRNEITMAHKLQTDVIQSTIENDHIEITLLFSHAQDTLMTINSEYNLAKHLGKLYKIVMERAKENGI